MHLLTVTPLLLLFITRAAPTPVPELVRRNQSLVFTPCYASNLECATYTPPLDYADPSVGNASLAVMRYKATKTPRLGTLWFNPGGPGGSGLEVFLNSTLGVWMSNVTGGYYDIASWDPRGVGQSTPVIKCFNNTDEELAFYASTPLVATGFEVKHGFSNPDDVAFLYNQTDNFDQWLIELGQRCAQLSGDGLKYVGTAAVVRDMVGMADLIDGPDSLINYWGFSYGTAVGSFLVNMFPDRMGRVVVDGTLNPVYWTQKPTYELWDYSISDVDKALVDFTNACADAGPQGCSISNGKSGPEIYNWISDLMDNAYDANKAGVNISSFSIRETLYNGMYYPYVWSRIADFLAAQYSLLPGNSNSTANITSRATPVKSKEELRDILQHVRKAPLSPIGTSAGLAEASNSLFDYSFTAITCSDAMDTNWTTSDVFHNMVNVSQTVSHIFGPRVVFLTTTCQRWPTRATERFTGPWNHTTKNPILVIGTNADPITPFKGAEYVADHLGKSAWLIEQEGPGHTSTSEHSDCTINKLAEYFIAGKLPKDKKTNCPVNQPLFAPSSVEVGTYTQQITNVKPVSEA